MLISFAVSLKNINIADLIVVALLLLALIVGAIRGFSNSIGGGAGSLIAIALGIIGVFFLKQYAEQLPAYLSLKNAIFNQVIKLSDGMQNVAIVDNGVIFVSAGDDLIKFTDTFSGSMVIVSKVIEKILVSQVSPQLDGSVSIATIVTATVANILLMVIIFSVVSLIVKLLLTMLSKIIIKITKNKPTFITVDRVVGVLFSITMVSVIMLGAFYYIATNHDSLKFATIVQTIEQSQIARWIYYNNPIIKHILPKL